MNGAKMKTKISALEDSDDDDEYPVKPNPSAYLLSGINFKQGTDFGRVPPVAPLPSSVPADRKKISTRCDSDDDDDFEFAAPFGKAAGGGSKPTSSPWSATSSAPASAAAAAAAAAAADIVPTRTKPRSTLTFGDLLKPRLGADNDPLLALSQYSSSKRPMHSRHLCEANPLSKNANSACDQCLCYVCGDKWTNCTNWADHCSADPSGAFGKHWTKKRDEVQAEQKAKKVASAAAAVSAKTSGRKWGNDDDDDFLDDAVDVKLPGSSSFRQVSAETGTGKDAATKSKRAYSSTSSSAAASSSSSNSRMSNNSKANADTVDSSFHVNLPVLPDKYLQRPFAPLALPAARDRLAGEVNPYAAQYLMPHQVEGVKWLWDKLCHRQGCILGDDMGMGKTITVAALFLAYFEKSGTLADGVRNRKMNAMASRRVHAMLNPSAPDLNGPPSPQSPTQGPPLVPKKPCLVVCPKSLVQNWNDELVKWGHFRVDMLRGDTKDASMEKIRSGATEIAIMSVSTLEKVVHQLSDVRWGIVVYDEAHDYLRHVETKSYKNGLLIDKVESRFMLTGTPVQNDLKEFWALMNMVTGQKWHSKEIYAEHYIDPMKNALSLSATPREVELGHRREAEHYAEIMGHYYLGRKKETLDGENRLKGKEEHVVLCDCTPLQKNLYMHLLSLPDFDNCRNYEQTCPCGVGHGMRKDCCIQYVIPLLRGPQADGNTLDPRAILWLQQHRDESNCKNCPACVSLACMHKLRVIAMHPALLQVISNERRSFTATEKNYIEFTEKALSRELLEDLGGSERPKKIRSMRDFVGMSGKMVTLEAMLTQFVRDGQKTLVFSHSTKMLDIIQAMVRFNGWPEMRLDGQTSSKKRSELVDKFQKENAPEMIFLISSKAGGVGLNLTAATRVVLYDTQWNPSTDQQSQDRAYRIGQSQSVLVYRLVTKGTLEELIYMRQLYKQNIQSTILTKGSGGGAADGDDDDDDDEDGDGGGGAGGDKKRGPGASASHKDTNSRSHIAREGNRFEGIQGDIKRKGELFGVHNLLQYSEESILESLRESLDKEAAASADLAASAGVGVGAGAAAATAAADTDEGAQSSTKRRKKQDLFQSVSETQVAATMARSSSAVAKILGDKNPPPEAAAAAAASSDGARAGGAAAASAAVSWQKPASIPAARAGAGSGVGAGAGAGAESAIKVRPREGEQEGEAAGGPRKRVLPNSITARAAAAAKLAN